MNKRDSIKQKINSLLKKTTENGSSEAEMFSALKKAEELMRKYSIHKTELEDAESKKREKSFEKKEEAERLRKEQEEKQRLEEEQHKAQERKT